MYPHAGGSHHGTVHRSVSMADEIILSTGTDEECVTAPSQLRLLDREAADILATLLVPPNFPAESLLSAQEVAGRVLGLVAKLNSREALVACAVVAMVASDDCTLERGVEIERSIIALHQIIARVKGEKEPKFPAWLKVAQHLLAQEKESADDAANQAMKGQFQKSVGEGQGPTLSKTQAGL